MVQQRGGLAKLVLVVVLTTCAVLFAALTPVEAARRVLYDPDHQTPHVAEAPGPVPEFLVQDCSISKECSYTFATSMATNVTINDVNCCRSIIRNGDECFAIALYYSDLGKPDFVKTDVYQWGNLVWNHCLSIA